MYQNPHGTAMNNTLQQISGAIGSAVLVTIMNKRMESSGEELVASATAAGKAPTTPEAIEALTSQAMLNGINFTFFISTFIAGIALILSLFMKRVVPPQQSETMTSESVRND